MMIFVKAVLYFAGYAFDFEDNVNQSPLDIEVGRHNSLVAKHRSLKQESIIRLIFTILYQIIIALIMIWSVVYGLYMAIRDKDVNKFGRTLFQVLIVLQYYFAISYFKNNQFYENILCNSRLKNYITIAIPAAALVSISLAGMNVALLTQDLKFNMYNEIYNTSNIPGKVFLCGLLFFDSLYSYLTFIINACVFAINMLYHRDVVAKYSTRLKDYIRQSMNTMRKLNIIAVEYSQMKGNFDTTVKLLTPFFSILNFFGFITMYFYLGAIENKTLSVTEITYFALFIITETVYIIAIQTVNVNISNIGDALNSNNLINTFFSGKAFTHTMPLDSNSVSNNYENMTFAQHTESIDDTLYVQRHDDYDDNNYNDNNDKQNLPFDTINSNFTNTEYHRNDMMNDNGYLETQMMLRNIMVSSMANQQMLDWVSLRNIVSSRWSTFKLFGVEFTDTAIISKLYGVIVAVLVSAQFGFLFNWW